MKIKLDWATDEFWKILSRQKKLGQYPKDITNH